MGRKELGEVLVKIGADVKDALKGFDEVSNRAVGFGEKMQAIGRKTTAAGQTLTKGITLPLLAVGAAGVASALSVDEALDKIRAGTGQTGKELKELEGVYRDLMRSVPAASGDIATAVADLNTRLGITGDQLRDRAEQFLELSRITGTDVKTNIESLTRVFGDWSVATEDQARVLDFFFKTSQQTGASVDSLAVKTVQYGAPLRQMGFGLEESVALMGKWEKEGVNSELVLGSLRIALGTMARANAEAGDGFADAATRLVQLRGEYDKNAERLRVLEQQLQLAKQRQSEFGENTSESARMAAQFKIENLERDIAGVTEAMTDGGKEIDSLTHFIETLQAEMGGLAKESEKPPEAFRRIIKTIQETEDETEAIGLAMQLFGARAGPDMAAAIREGRFGIDELVKTLEASDETIIGTGEATTSFADKLVQLKNKATLALEPIGTKLIGAFEKALPTIEKVLGFITRLVIGFSNLPGPVQVIILGLIGFLFILGPVLVMVGSVISIIGTLITVAGALGIGLGALIGIMGIIVIAVIAVIAIGILLVKHWDEVKAFLIHAWEVIKLVFVKAAEFIWKLLTTFPGLLWLPAFIIRNWDAIVAFFAHAWDAIKQSVKKGVDAVGGLVVDLVELFVDKVVGFVTAAFDLGKNIITGLWDGMKDVWGRFTNWLDEKWEGIKDKVKSIFGISSPSRVFRGYGEDVVAGLQIGLDPIDDAIDFSSLFRPPEDPGFGGGGGLGGSRSILIQELHAHFHGANAVDDFDAWLDDKLEDDNRDRAKKRGDLRP